MGRSISIIGTKITLKGLTYIPQVDGKMIVLDMATPTKRSGYIRTDTEKWATNETARFIFVPVLGLRGTTLKIDAKSGQNLRIAFLKKPYFSNGSTPDFCQGTSLITRDAPVESFTEVIPSDCAYLYVFTTDIYGVDVTPTINDIIIPATYIITISGDEIINNGQTWQVEMGDSFVLEEIEANAGYGINLVTIIMGNTDITQEAYQDGMIVIPRVTGNVVITVETASQVNTNMFTRRTTADGLQVLNNKALLKGIRGNSLLFAQRIRSYNFTGGTLGDWSVARGTYSIADGILSVTGPSSNTPLIYVKPANNPVYTSASHKYLQCAKVRITNFAGAASRYINIGSNSINGGSLNIKDNDWHIVSGTLTTGSTAPSGNARWFQVYIGSGMGTAFDLEWVQCFDLTVLGAPEISSYAEFIKRFPLLPYPYNSSAIILNNNMTGYISKDGEDTILQTLSIDVTQLTGKLNGEGESVTLFENGMKSSCNEAVNDTYDEIKQVDGVWKAFKRIGDTRGASANAISKRVEYDILSEEEVYVLDNQDIPTEITVGDQGVEEILPANEATPVTAPAIMEIQYGAIPSRGLLGGLLGGTKGGGSDEPTDDGEEIDYEEEPLDEPIEDETKEDEKDEPIEPIDEK